MRFQLFLLAFSLVGLFTVVIPASIDDIIADFFSGGFPTKIASVLFFSVQVVVLVVTRTMRSADRPKHAATGRVQVYASLAAIIAGLTCGFYLHNHQDLYSYASVKEYSLFLFLLISGWYFLPCIYRLRFLQLSSRLPQPSRFSFSSVHLSHKSGNYRKAAGLGRMWHWPLFALALIVFLYPDRVIRTNDTAAAIRISTNLWTSGTFRLNNYYGEVNDYLAEKISFDPGIHNPVMLPDPENPEIKNQYYIPYYLAFIDGDIHTVYPLATSLIASPFIALAAFTGADYNSEDADTANSELLNASDTLIAALLTAFSAIVMTAMAIRIAGYRGIMIGMVFIFASPAFSLLSATLWQHTTVVLFLSITLYLLLNLKRQFALLATLGAALALLPFLRPSLAILLPFLFFIFLDRTLFSPAKQKSDILSRPLQSIFYILAGALPVALFLSALNLILYDNILGGYPILAENVFGSDSAFSASLWTGLYGNLFSPGRGWFVFFPYFLLIVFAAKPVGRIRLILILALISYILYFSSYLVWTGGFSYGPRFLADLLPIWMLMLSGIFRGKAFRKKALRLICALFLAWSVFVQVEGRRDQYAFDFWHHCIPETLEQAALDWSRPPFFHNFLPFRADLTMPYRPQDLCHTGRISTEGEQRSIHFSADDARIEYLPELFPEKHLLFYQIPFQLRGGNYTVHIDGSGNVKLTLILFWVDSIVDRKTVRFPENQAFTLEAGNARGNGYIVILSEEPPDWQVQSIRIERDR